MPKLTLADPRKRSTPLEGYDSVYSVYTGPSKRRKLAPSSTDDTLDDSYSLLLKNFGEATRAISQVQQELAVEQGRTALVSSEIQKLRNEFEDQKTKAIQKYEADMQSVRDVASQLEQRLQNETQRAAAAQQQTNDLRTAATAHIGELNGMHQETMEQAAAALSQAQKETRAVREERDSALTRISMLENSHPDVEMEEESRPDPLKKERDEASAEIAGLRGQLSAKERTISDQAARIKQLEALLPGPGGNVSSPPQQLAASIPSPPEEPAAPWVAAPETSNSPSAVAPRRGIKNHLARAGRDVLQRGDSGGASAGGVSKNRTRPKTRGTRTRGSASAAYPRTDVLKEHKSDMLDSYVKSGAASKVFNQTKREKDAVDLYENEFHGKGFDSFEADKIVVDYTDEFDVYPPSKDGLGQQVWNSEGDVEYYADRGQRPPILIEIYEDDLTLEKKKGDEHDEDEDDRMRKAYILPLSKDLSVLRPEQKYEYAQACIIAKLPETQTEAARAFLSTTELQAFEQRMFKGPKPIGQCHEELEYPKMFKKVVKYLRSTWSFRDAAKRWAAGEDALHKDQLSCWPPTFASIDSCMTGSFKTEEGYENEVDKPYKLSRSMQDDLASANPERALNIFDGQSKNPPTEDKMVSNAAGVGVNDDGSKKTLPITKGLDGMFSLPK